MNNFTSYAPTLFDFGRDAAKDAGALVRRFGGTRALLVTGGGSVKKNGAFQAVTASLDASGVPWFELSGVQPNPRSGKVYEGVDTVRREGLDFILAIGGGSCIDTAKAVGIGACYDGDFWDFFARKATLERSLPVGVVLTISASGSEGSGSCVITHENGELKWGCPRTDLIRPKFSVMDPCYTFSLPAYQTACGAVDMLAHVLERYFTNTPDVALTDHLAEGLMRTILDAAPRALAEPEDYAARADLMWAGMLAHNDSVGVGREQDWASHQIGHELSALGDCAHGATLAVIMPAWMEYVVDHDPARFARLAERVLDIKADPARPEAAARAAIARLREIFRAWGMPATLADVGLSASDIPAMIAHRAQKPSGFPFGKFISIGPSEMEAILRIAAGE